MTNQVQGEILYVGVDPAEPVYTPWMPVRGDLATYGVEVLQITGSTTLTWAVQTRTRESSTASLALTDQTVTSKGVDTAQATADTEELFRYRFSTGATADLTKFVVFRPLQPSWQTDR